MSSFTGVARAGKHFAIQTGTLTEIPNFKGARDVFINLKHQRSVCVISQTCIWHLQLVTVSVLCSHRLPSIFTNLSQKLLTSLSCFQTVFA